MEVARQQMTRPASQLSNRRGHDINKRAHARLGDITALATVLDKDVTDCA
jgi:hypothetical protein